MSLPAWCLSPPSGNADDPARLRRQLRAAESSESTRPPDRDTLSPEEQLLVDRIRNGDLAAFEQLYRATYTPLWRFAYRMLHSADAAQDVIHDVFFTLWTRRDRWSVQAGIRQYLYGAVRQRTLKDVRHQHVVDRTTLRASGDPTFVPGAGMAIESPDISTERDALVSALRTAIATLPDRQRLAMELYLEGDLTPVEIAAALGVSAVAARKLLAKGSAALREILPEP
jgi:RNA polymerase sigma-70 factor (ECF subfamily)